MNALASLGTCKALALQVVLAIAPVHSGAVDPLAVLHRWDRDRAAAFVAESPQRIRALYDPRSAAAGADVRLMSAYRARGIRVTALEPQVFAAHVVRRSAVSLRLRVADRLLATGDDGRACVRLPTSPASVHVLAMRREAGRWVMVSVAALRPSREARSR